MREMKWTPLQLAEVKTPRRIGAIWRAKGTASRRRIKFEDRAACYHVMSRTVNGEIFFDDVEKEAFRRMMWRMAAFSGVEVLTYAVMGNHFHILAHVPEKKKWLQRFEGEGGEEKLLTHLASIYSKKFIAQLRAEIAFYRTQKNERAVVDLLERFKRRFCDISLFVKELKERFSRWFNKLHERKGTLWMDRFKSILVDGPQALATMAAYIDLNPVRAGLVADPFDYKWSGYGEACAGSRRARSGICQALDLLDLPRTSCEEKSLPLYRMFLYGEGLGSVAPERLRGRCRKGFSLAEWEKVLEEKGRLSPATSLRKRIAGFTNGMAMGGDQFVREVAEWYQKARDRKRVRRPKETDQRDLFVMK